VSHKCTPVVDAKLQTNEKARGLLTKVSSGSRARNPIKKTTRPPTDPMKLAAYHRVEVIKMQHKAVPLDPRTSWPPLLWMSDYISNSNIVNKKRFSGYERFV